MVIFKTKKVEFTARNIFFKGERRTFHNDERVNTQGNFHAPNTETPKYIKQILSILRI